jgi:TrmH family RNA methyltransferase
MLVKSQVKYIQSLGQKKHRDEAAVFIAEGPKLVAELLEEVPGHVQQVYATQDWINANKTLIEQKGTDCTGIEEHELQKISQLSTANQVLALVSKFANEEIPAVSEWVLALDTIQDPGNLGTIIRIADWFGVKQVICSPDCADMYNSKVVQSTMGSIARVRVVYTDLTQWLSRQKEKRVYAAVLQGQDITSIKKPAPGILVIGNESKGISDEVLAKVNVQVTIPQKGKAESLNAAVATGILLSHIS